MKSEGHEELRKIGLEVRKARRIETSPLRRIVEEAEAEEGRKARGTEKPEEKGERNRRDFFRPEERAEAGFGSHSPTAWP